MRAISLLTYYNNKVQDLQIVSKELRKLGLRGKFDMMKVLKGNMIFPSLAQVSPHNLTFEYYTNAHT